MKKYEIVKDSKIIWCGTTLYRIRACKDFTTVSGREVYAGDLGGYVESEKNLSQDGRAWVCGDSILNGDAYLYTDPEQNWATEK